MATTSGLCTYMPGIGDEPIKCRRVCTSLDDPNRPPHRALSYVWGEQANTRAIELDGRKVQVTTNLFMALSRLRPAPYRRSHRESSNTVSLSEQDNHIEYFVYWVDQLCIEQRDNEEKRHQVSLMSRTYKECALCVIWLGEPSLAVPTIVPADEVISDVTLSMLNAMLEEQKSEAQDGSNMEWFRKIMQLVAACESYLSRTWTIQEAKLPSVLSIQWGGLEIPGNNYFTNLCPPSRLFPPGASYPFNERSVMNIIVYIRNSLQTPTESLDDACDLVLATRDHQATNPEDKIYGLMGLFKQAPFPGVSGCNYTMRAAELYSRVTLDILVNYGCTLVIALSNGEPRETPHLPSWAIDFVACRDLTKPRGHYVKWWQTKDLYNACNNYYYMSREELDALCYRTVLPVRAMKVSTLHLVGEPLDVVRDLTGGYAITKPELVTEMLRLRAEYAWEYLQQYASTSCQYDDPETAICKTLLEDCLYEPKPEPKERYRRSNSADVLDIEYLLDTISQDVSRMKNFSLYRTTFDRSFCTTLDGQLATGPPTAKLGDEVWVVANSSMPMVLRPVSTNSGCKRFNVLGSSYVHGIMDGELVRAQPDAWETIEIE